jgi:hypothetical protein
MATISIWTLQSVRIYDYVIVHELYYNDNY